AGMTLSSMSGTGWTCTTNSCNRSDQLASGASYPAITVVVNVSSSAAASVTNSATVSGGGDASSHTANDVTAVAANLSITGTITNGAGASVALSGTGGGSTTANSSGVYTFTGLPNGQYTVTPTLAGSIMSPASQA